MIPPPVIGLIGAIGAGKSAAARCFAARGADVIDADALGHEAINRPESLAAIRARWGSAVLQPDGSANRRAVAGIVFAEPAELKWLESRLFPVIGELTKRRVNESAAPVVVLDAALLLEAGWGGFCDRIAYLDATRPLRVQRVAGRGWSDADLAAREAAQWPAERKRDLADAVIENDGTLEALQAKVDELMERWNGITRNVDAGS